MELSFDEIFLMSLFLRRFFGGRAEREPEEENGRGGEAAEENGKPVQTEEEKLSELLESHVYNEEQLGEIMLAIGAGISYDKILQMADTKTVLKR